MNTTQEEKSKLIRFLYRCKSCGRYSNNTNENGGCVYCKGELIKRPTPRNYEESLKIEKEWNRLPEK